MDWQQVKAFLDSSKDSAEVKAYLAENAKPTKEQLVEMAGKPEGLEALQSVLDRERTKAIDGFKTKGMVAEIEKATAKAVADAEKELKAKHKIHDDPALVEVEKLRKELEQERGEKAKEKLRAKIREAFPEELRDFADHFIGPDEERTGIVVENFKKSLDAYGQKIVEGKVKGGQYNPGGKGNNNGAPGKIYTREEIANIAKNPQQWDQHREAILQQTTGGAQ